MSASGCWRVLRCSQLGCGDHQATIPFDIRHESPLTLVRNAATDTKDELERLKKNLDLPAESGIRTRTWARQIQLH